MRAGHWLVGRQTAGLSTIVCWVDLAFAVVCQEVDLRMIGVMCLAALAALVPLCPYFELLQDLFTQALPPLPASFCKLERSRFLLCGVVADVVAERSFAVGSKLQQRQQGTQELQRMQSLLHKLQVREVGRQLSLHRMQSLLQKLLVREVRGSSLKGVGFQGCSSSSTAAAGSMSA